MWSGFSSDCGGRCPLLVSELPSLPSGALLQEMRAWARGREGTLSGWTSVAFHLLLIASFWELPLPMSGGLSLK